MESKKTPTSPILSFTKAIPFAERAIIRRDGSRSPFDLDKITRAVALAFHDVRTNNAPNPDRDDRLVLFGLDSVTFQQVVQISESVSMMLELYYREGRHPSIEQVQDSVERSIAASGEWDVARAYVLYRARHSERRLTRYGMGAEVLGDYIAQAKYARYRDDLGRRETYAEGVERVRDMHLEFFGPKLGQSVPAELPNDILELAGHSADFLSGAIGGRDLKSLINGAFEAVSRKDVLPSMRSMQFGGKAILTNHSRLFNCSFSNVDRLAFFREYFFLLLSGCGVGFSVQRQHVSQLPQLPKRDPVDDLPVLHYAIGDTIEGWCDALDALFGSFYSGHKIEFNYSLIRPKGALLKTSGGKAPGHRPLKRALEKVEEIIEGAAGRTFRTIEIYDICMFIAKAVLSGGIRRSATICLFSPDDEDMMNAKTGNWFEKNPQRSASNNSAVLNRSEDNRKHFEHLFNAQKEFGEPGFYFCDHKESGCNPCVPADTWVATDKGPRQVQDLIGQQFGALVNGESFESTDRGFFATGTKAMIMVKTEEGFELRLTPNHQVLVQRKLRLRRNPANRNGLRIPTPVTEWIEAGDLREGDRLVMHNHGVVNWSGFGTKTEGWLVGSLLGDGNLELSGNRANLDYWGEDRSEMLSLAVGSLHEAFGDGIRSVGSDQPAYGRCRVGSRPLLRFADKFGLSPSSKNLNAFIERTSSEFTEGFLSGWFDADGSVQGFQRKGVSIRLSSVNKENLQVAQRMLLRLGIYATIYPDRNRHRPTAFLPDGKGGKKEYDVQPLHDLIISGEDMVRFESRIGFTEPAKAKALASKLAEYRRAINRTNFVATVKELVDDGTEPVYDCTIPGPHAFDANGVYVHNCVEIALNPVIDWELSPSEFENLYSYGYQGDLPGTTRLSGFQMCNLSTINAAAANTKSAFLQSVVNAAVIGTIQAAYTDMPYLGPVTRIINEHDALLGISICGFMDNPKLYFDAQMLTEGALLARATNHAVARLIGIRPSARVTCVKPEGTASLLLGAASGIHPHHARRYFRHVQANRLEPVYAHFKSVNPQMTAPSVYNPDRDDVMCFPVETTDDALLRSDVNAIKFLELVRLVQQSWVINGTDESNRNPELCHNVSNTCTVKQDEWGAVKEFIWENRGYFTGISLLVDDGDKKYPQAPREEVSASEADTVRWNSLAPNRVDYTQLFEREDNTDLNVAAPACASGSCELVR